MCVAVPGEVISVRGTTAKIRIHKAELEAESALVDNVVPGEKVLVHAGFIIEKLAEDESIEMNELLKQYSNIPEVWGEDP